MNRRAFLAGVSLGPVMAAAAVAYPLFEGGVLKPTSAETPGILPSGEMVIPRRVAINIFNNSTVAAYTTELEEREDGSTVVEITIKDLPPAVRWSRFG